MQKKYITLLSLVFLIVGIAYGQLDDTFWFAMPEITPQHQPSIGEKTAFRITSSEDDTYGDSVIIEMPAQGIKLGTLVLSPHQTLSLDITNLIETSYNSPSSPGGTQWTVTSSDSYGASLTWEPSDNTIECGQPGTEGIKTNRGILIRSLGRNASDLQNKITVYCDRYNTNNRDIWALKGKNGLGKDFLVPTQNIWPNHNHDAIPSLNGIAIVATTNSTSIVINSPKAFRKAGYSNTEYAANVDHTITLDRGETFAIVASSINADDHLGGTIITSNELIAVTWYDDSVKPIGQGYDVTGDQVIPTNLAGYEFIVMRGNLSFNPSTTKKCREYAFVLATQNNTNLISTNAASIYGLFVDPKNYPDINNTFPTHKTTTLQRGQIGRMLMNASLHNNGNTGTDPSKVNYDALYMKFDKPVLVFHITGFGDEIGGAVVPSIDQCTGSKDVSVVWSDDSQDFFIQLMTKTDNINNVYVIMNNGSSYQIPSNLFLPANPDGTWSYLRKDRTNFRYAATSPVSVAANYLYPIRIKSTSRFHMSIVEGNTSGCKYGYFSSFAQDTGSANTSTFGVQSAYSYFCYGEQIPLIATGGLEYTWQYNGDASYNNQFLLPINQAISSAKLEPVFSVAQAQYLVTIKRECYLGPNQYLTLPIPVRVYQEVKASFDTVRLSPNCCSPVEYTLTNQDQTVTKYNWTIENETGTTFYDDYTNTSHPATTPLDVTFTNQGNTVDTYNVTLIANKNYRCYDTIEKTFTINPEIRAVAKIAKSEGCRQDILIGFFHGASSPNFDRGIYNFGDGEDSVFTLACLTDTIWHTYHNYTDNDVIRQPYLVLENTTTGCTDTTYLSDVIVPGVARANFTVNSISSDNCNPVSYNIHNTSKGDVDYRWWFYHGNDTVSHGPNLLSVFNDKTIKYTLPGTTNVPDTFYVYLAIKKKNLTGATDPYCYDSHGPVAIVVYPEPTLSITPASPGIICDGTTLNFNSTILPAGLPATYTWSVDGVNMGNSTTFSNLFQHYQPMLKNFNVQLVAISNYGNCNDTVSTTVPVASYVDAEITISSDNVCIPPGSLTVTNNTSANSEKTHLLWNLDGGSGTTSNNSPFQVTYTNTSGSVQNKTIILSNYSNNLNTCTASDSAVITVNPEFTPDFTPSPTTICHNGSITFTNNSKFDGLLTPITGSTANAQFSWDFGDGSNSSDVNPVHTFKNIQNNGVTPQEYTVTLTVTVNNCTETVQKKIYVLPEVKAEFSANNYIVCSGAVISLTEQASGENTYTWSTSGGGTFSSITAANPTFSATNPNPNNPYIATITLTVSNSGSCPSTISKDITIYPALNPVFTPNDTEDCGPFTVTFQNQSTGGSLTSGTLTSIWDFNDSPASINNSSFVTHTFNNRSSKDSTYSVTLTIYNAGCTPKPVTHDIKVYPEVKADFQYAKGECSPLNVTITNNSLNGNDFFWDFDAMGKDTTHTVNGSFHWLFTNDDASNYKEYPITLISQISLHKACNDTITKNIRVYPKVVATIIADTVDFCSPDTVNFCSSLSKGYHLTSTWDFGDNASGTSQTISHLYDNLTASYQPYVAKLTVKDTNGCTDNTTINIAAHPHVTANFTYLKDVNDKCTPYNVTINSKSSLNGNKFDWHFDGASNDATYTSAGSFTKQFDNLSTNYIDYGVELVLTDNNTGCKDSITKPVRVYPHLIPAFNPKFTEGCNPLKVEFDNQTTSLATTYKWDFGDGQSSSAKDTTHLFSHRELKDKPFTVTMTATQDSTGCSLPVNGLITVYSYVEAKFGIMKYADWASKGSSGNKANILGDCTPFDVYIMDSSMVNGTYSWDFDDGSAPFQGKNPGKYQFINNISATKLNDQRYNIFLTVTNTHDCIDTLTRSIVVYPRSVPDFSGDFEICSPENVTFNNKSLVDSVTRYYWTFADGSSSTQDPPLNKLFTNNYYVKDSISKVILTTTTKHGCSDDTSYNITIHPKPWARFYPEQDNACPPFTASLVNDSYGVGLIYDWDFANDSTVSTNKKDTQHPIYYNDSTGQKTFNVKLKATTIYGCTDVITLPIVTNPNVIAKFDIEPINMGCSPLHIKIKNHSTQTVSEHSWDFGDGSSLSPISEPDHIYYNLTDKDQYLTISYKGTSKNNCWDTISKPVIVYASPRPAFNALYEEQTYPDTLVTFEDLTPVGPWTYTWDFGDNKNFVTNDPLLTFEHRYTGWGAEVNNIFHVSLNVKSNTHATCDSTTWRNIRILPPLPAVEITKDTAGCIPLGVQFTINDFYCKTFSWDFGDGGTADVKTPYHQFDVPGIYNVKVVVTGDGGTREANKIVNVYALPEASFVAIPDSVMLPEQPVQFFNTSANGASYIWDFGDNTETSKIENPTHQYSDIGNYKVLFVVLSNEGCIDKDSTLIVVEGKGNIEFPNIFIPSSDSPINGSYDEKQISDNVFHPIYYGVEKYDLWVFNRWGEQVFHTNNILEGWNGRYGNTGAELGQDVYFWKAKGKYENHVPFKKAGDVTLIRK